MLSKNVTDGLKNALIEYGAMLDDWKINVVDVESIGYSDYAFVTVDIIKKRCRKPCIQWKLKVDTVRKIVYFNESSFIRY